MNISETNRLALRGLQKGLKQVAESSEQFTRSIASAQESQAAAELVDVKLGKLQVYASAKVMKVSDEIQETILDVMA